MVNLDLQTCAVPILHEPTYEERISRELDSPKRLFTRLTCGLLFYRRQTLAEPFSYVRIFQEQFFSEQICGALVWQWQIFKELTSRTLTSRTPDMPLEIQENRQLFRTWVRTKNCPLFRTAATTFRVPAAGNREP